ncbi:Uncharacterised protein [Mycoplasma putrefaciens]|nr:Uncharacterised protein [Mycoplasma putrefaciens]
MFFTLSLIIITAVPLIKGLNNTQIATIQLSAVVFFTLLSLIGLLMLKEPRDDAKTFPFAKTKPEDQVAKRKVNL